MAALPPLSGLVVCVDVRTDGVDASDAVKRKLKDLGASCQQTPGRRCTHLAPPSSPPTALETMAEEPRPLSPSLHDTPDEPSLELSATAADEDVARVSDALEGTPSSTPPLLALPSSSSDLASGKGAKLLLSRKRPPTTPSEPVVDQALNDHPTESIAVKDESPAELATPKESASTITAARQDDKDKQATPPAVNDDTQSRSPAKDDVHDKKKANDTNESDAQEQHEQDNHSQNDGADKLEASKTAADEDPSAVAASTDPQPSSQPQAQGEEKTEGTADDQSSSDGAAVTPATTTTTKPRSSKKAKTSATKSKELSVEGAGIGATGEPQTKRGKKSPVIKAGADASTKASKARVLANSTKANARRDLEAADQAPASKRAAIQPVAANETSDQEDSEATLTPVTRRAAIHSIVLSGLTDDECDIASAVLRQLRSSHLYVIASQVSETTTHVVSSGRRTLKVLQGAAAGCWLVSFDWIEASAVANKWLDERDFELRDQFPRAAVLREGSRLLKNQRVFVAPDVSPSRKDVLRMVTAQGAHVVPERDDADLVLDNDANAATSKTGTASVQHHNVLDSFLQPGPRLFATPKRPHQSSAARRSSSRPTDLAQPDRELNSSA
ncbi:uncharacterized protein MONBRDRAFT_11169, partial [Monosiga brevicollis MX1]